MEESALVDRVFLRIISTDTDDQFQASLHKFLAPVLLKLASPSEDVRKKVMELLVHVNKRLKSRPQITLPIDQLIAQYNDSSNSSMVTNFSIIYIKMGFPRLSLSERFSLVPEILKLLPNKPPSQQDTLISLTLSVMKDLTLPGDVDKKRQLYGLVEHPATRSYLLQYMLNVLLLPYSPHFPAPDGPAVATTPQCPPCFSEASYKRIAGAAFPAPDEIERLKSGIMFYLTSDIIPVKEAAVHLIIASSDSRHTIATAGDNELKRVSSDIDWEDGELMGKLATLYLGTVNQVKKDQSPPVPKEQKTLPAPTRIKAKLFPLLLKSKAAAQLFPQNIQIACDGLAAAGTNAKLKKFSVQYICNIAEFCVQAQLKAIGPTLLTYLWKAIADTSATDLKPLAYVAIGKLAKQVPALVFDKVDVISKLISQLTKETENQVKSSIQEAITLMTPSLSKARHDVKNLLEQLIMTGIDSPESSVRRMSVYLAHHAFHPTWLPTRYLLLLACSDQLVDIRSEAAKYLHSGRQMELPVAEHSFDLDLYPKFDEISSFIEKQRQKRISEKKTYTRGATVLAFNPDTLQQIVEYLRTCLAWSSGVKQPHVTQIEDWMDQAPLIYQQLVEERPDTQPAKQVKLSAPDSVIVLQSVKQYAQLVLHNVESQASGASVYLMCEILSLFPTLAEEFSHKITWFKGLANHHDLRVQTYSAQILAVLAFEGKGQPVDLVNDYLTNFKPASLSVEQVNGSLLALGSLISYAHKPDRTPADLWAQLTSKLITKLEPLISGSGSHLQVALRVLSQISTVAPFYIDYGSEESVDGEINAYNIVKTLCEKVKSSKLDSKNREKIASCLGSIGISDRKFPHRRKCLDGLFECSTTKELELHFTIGEALVVQAQALDGSQRRNKWRQSESDFWSTSAISGDNEMDYLVSSILDKYIVHVNPHIKQAACVWLLTVLKKSNKFSEVTRRSADIQSAFMRLLTDNDEITQDISSKGLGLVYDSCSTEEQRKALIADLVDTLMTGKSSTKKTGEVSSETKLFTEGGLGSTPEGQGLSTYKELCAIATDLNQPDLIYKFLHLANHQSTWNSRKGAAFGFSTIAAQAGEQLAPYMAQIVPKLFRYTFDPNVKIQTAMRSIWNAVVKETKPTVDKYLRSICEDLLDNLTNNQWRVRESSCLAVNDLLRGRQLNDIIDLIPRLWSVLFRLLDDIKESTRLAATTAAKTLSRQCIKICDINYGSIGQTALSLILPVLLSGGISSNVTEVRQLSLDTVVSISKNAGKFLKPHIHTLVPVMLESLSGLEPQYLNYLAVRVSGQDDVQQKLDRARVAAFKMSPMMDSINLCVQQVDGSVLPELTPMLIDLIKKSIGLGTKVGVANVISLLCTQCGIEVMQPFAGKLMSALLHGLSDKNATVRKSYATSLAVVCKLAKDSSVDKLIDRLYDWYFNKDEKSLHEACGVLLKAMVENCPDTLNSHKSRVLPLVFLAIHEPDKHTSSGRTGEKTTWDEIWTEIAVGTDAVVRLYIQEIISITDSSLQSSSWHRKAQGAAAMGTTAKSAGSNIDSKALNHLLRSLLSGLSGRTWNGKESLLTALSDIVNSSADKLKSGQSEISTQEIVSSCLREAEKESLHYKVPAIRCLVQVSDALDTDVYKDFYDIVSPLLSLDKHPDEEISDKLMSEFREAALEGIGKAWPSKTYDSTQSSHIAAITRLLLDRIPTVAWKEQMAAWSSLLSIIKKTDLAVLGIEKVGDWSVSEFITQMVTVATKLAAETKYSALREVICNILLELCQLNEKDGPTLADDSKLLILSLVNDSTITEADPKLHKVFDSIKASLSSQH